MSQNTFFYHDHTLEPKEGSSITSPPACCITLGICLIENKFFLRDLATNLYPPKSGGVYFIVIALALHGFLTTQGILFLISW